MNPNELISILLTIPAALFSLSVHETAHGYMSYKLGDPTAKNLGRLTLNPMKHLDVMGLICMIFFRFGWAKPVPVNSRYYKKPRRDMALVAAAGPISNLILAFLGVLLLHIIYLIYALVAKDASIPFLHYWNGAMLGAPPAVNMMSVKLMYVIFLFFINFIILNISLAVFNLIPIPPLDGSRIAYIFLPTKVYFGIMRYEKYIMIGLFVLVMVGALSGILSTVTGFILKGFMNFVELIPIFRFY